LEIFQYDFMQRAFLCGILVAVISPCIGVVVVLKRFSLIGDALAHNSLAGVALGLMLGFNPVAGAIFMALVAALSLEKIRQSFPCYGEVGLAVLTSSGIGLAAIFSGFIKNSANFNSFLFGSIVAISDAEFYSILALSILVVLIFFLLYKELFYIVFDEQAARLANIPVDKINFIFMFLVAVTISVSARIVGTLIISSLMVLPVATALQLGCSYKKTVLYAISFALIATVIGLFLSFYLNLKPGGTIVLSSIVLLLIVIFRRKKAC